jgi:hypothetical protein
MITKTGVSFGWTPKVTDDAGRVTYHIDKSTWYNDNAQHPISGRPMIEPDLILLGLKKSRVNGVTVKWTGYLYSGHRVIIYNR